MGRPNKCRAAVNSSGTAGMDFDGWQAAPGGGSDPVVVEIHTPARPEYIEVLRAACGQLAPQLGCTVAETADLRLAVDEACGFLLRNCVRLSRDTEQDGLVTTFTVNGSDLRIALQMQADTSVPPGAGDGEFGWTILTALVDDFTWQVTESTVRVEIRKERVGGSRG